MNRAVVIRRVQGRWDRGRNILWFDFDTSDQQTYSVGFPLARVAACFYEELQAQPEAQTEVGRCNIGLVDIIGDPDIYGPDTVDGFLSGITRALKKATRPVRRAIKRTTRKLRRKAWRGLKTAWKGTRYMGKYAARYGRMAARSKALGYGLGALSVACPAVGGPALAAWTVANRADKMLRAAETVAKRGPRNAAERALLGRARTYKRRGRRIARSNAPAARMLMAGFRSIR